MKRYRGFIHAVLGQEYANSLAEVTHSIIPGRRQFVIEIRDRVLKHKAQDRELPALRAFLERLSKDKKLRTMVQRIEKLIVS